MSECSVVGLQEQLKNGEIHLVDVREQVEFAGGRVKGASLLPLGELEKRHSELDHSKPIYVMCRTGRRSAEAQRKLHDLGFTNVVNVSGGIEAWKKEDLPASVTNTLRGRSNARCVSPQLARTHRSTAKYFRSSLLHCVVRHDRIRVSLYSDYRLVWNGLADAKMPWNRGQYEIQTVLFRVSCARFLLHRIGQRGRDHRSAA